MTVSRRTFAWTAALAAGLLGCDFSATHSLEPSVAIPSVAAIKPSESPSLVPSPKPSTNPGPVACSPDEPAPEVAERPGIHPPDGVVGTSGGGWGVAEVGSFEWREGNTISEAIGVPAIVPPEATYRGAHGADRLFIAFSEPVSIESWKIITFPWAWYEEDPPAGAESEVWNGGQVGESQALCIALGEERDFSLTAKVEFGGGNHAIYRWRVIVPSD